MNDAMLLKEIVCVPEMESPTEIQQHALARSAVVIPIGDQATFDTNGQLQFALMSKIALDPTSLPNGALTEDFGKIHQPLGAHFDQMKLAQDSAIVIGVAQIIVDKPGP